MGNKMSSVPNTMSSGFRRSNNIGVQPSVLAGGALANVLDLQGLRVVKGYANPVATGSYLIYADANNAQQLDPSNPLTATSVMPVPLRIGANETVLNAVFATTPDWVAAGAVTAQIQSGTNVAGVVTAVTALTAASTTLAAANAHKTAAGNGSFGPANAATTDGFLVATTAVAAVSAGTLRVTLLVLSA